MIVFLFLGVIAFAQTDSTSAALERMKEAEKAYLAGYCGQSLENLQAALTFEGSDPLINRRALDMAKRCFGQGKVDFAVRLPADLSMFWFNLQRLKSPEGALRFVFAPSFKFENPERLQRIDMVSPDGRKFPLLGPDQLKQVYPLAAGKFFVRSWSEEMQGPFPPGLYTLRFTIAGNAPFDTALLLDPDPDPRTMPVFSYDQKTKHLQWDVQPTHSFAPGMKRQVALSIYRGEAYRPMWESSFETHQTGALGGKIAVRIRPGAYTSRSLVWESFSLQDASITYEHLPEVPVTVPQ